MRFLVILALTVVGGCDNAEDGVDLPIENLAVENLIVNDMAADPSLDNTLEAPSPAPTTAQVSSSSGSAVPNFDTVEHCRQVSEVGGTGSYAIEETCREMEAEAEAEVASRTIPDRVYNHCKQVAEVGGPGSYSIFNTCVDMELGAASRL